MPRKVESLVPKSQRRGAKRSGEVMYLLGKGISSSTIVDHQEHGDTLFPEKKPKELADIVQEVQDSRYVLEAKECTEKRGDNPQIEVVLINGNTVFIKLFFTREEAQGYLKRSDARWNIHKSQLQAELTRRCLIIIDATHRKGVKYNFEDFVRKMMPSIVRAAQS